MATKSDLKAAQERIFARPRPESRSDRELLRKTEDDGVYPSPLNLKAIRVDRIVPDASRPERTFADAALAELGHSLLAHGQIVPILVQYDGKEDVFVLIDGERRWRAAQRAGMETLQAIVLGSLAPAERCEQRIVAALHQGSWQNGEGVRALEQYKSLLGLATEADAAAQLGVSEATLKALLHGGEEAGAPLAAGDALSRVAAAISLVDTLAGLQPGTSETAEVVRLLDQLASRLAAQRSRLRPSRPRQRTGATGQTTEGAAKPVEHLPTWGAG